MSTPMRSVPGSLIRALFQRDQGADCDDPMAAPTSHRGPDPAPPFTWRRAAQNMIWVYAFGLIFMVFAITALFDGDPSLLVVGIRFVVIALMVLGYLGSAWAADCSIRTRWLYLGCYVTLLALSTVVWGWALIGYGAYVAVMLATLLPWRQSRIAVVAWAGALVLVGVFGGAPSGLYIAVMSLGIGLTTAAGMEAGAVQGRLQRAERRVATLSVAAERERIGRDLHDILGHSLTAISIKAGLAARLVEVDPIAAKGQIIEIEQVARQALADVRTTASGMQEVRLATEIASARSVLLAAGIESQMPSALPPLSDEVSELFGYVVRESITNVVRHSDAGVCTVLVSADAVEVRDDGRGLPATTGDGSGFTGLRSRMAAAGGSLLVRTGESGGCLVRAELSRPPIRAEPTGQAVSLE